MQTILVDQTQVAFGECNILAKDFLAEFSLYNVGEFDIIVGVQLSLLPIMKMQLKTEIFG